jgi:7-carboxy-7-deazaguanine synthase
MQVGLPNGIQQANRAEIHFKGGPPKTPSSSRRPLVQNGQAAFTFFCYSFAVRESRLLITEIFHSLQGETSLVGLPFAFIRLTGCNLRCTYCDSAYAFKGGRLLTIDEILTEIQPYGVKHVLLTGGEPLLQRPVPLLIEALRNAKYEVSVETHGEVSIENASKLARIVMDVKTPASDMARGRWKENLPFLKPDDEVKFIIASEADYDWAKRVVQETHFPTREILFSPVIRTAGSPGEYPGVSSRWLAERILQDRLPVRFQLQLHKILWGSDRRGV